MHCIPGGIVNIVSPKHDEDGICSQCIAWRSGTWSSPPVRQMPLRDGPPAACAGEFFYEYGLRRVREADEAYMNPATSLLPHVWLGVLEASIDKSLCIESVMSEAR